jgi:hypothetical protein
MQNGAAAAAGFGLLVRGRPTRAPPATLPRYFMDAILAHDVWCIEEGGRAWPRFPDSFEAMEIGAPARAAVA